MLVLLALLSAAGFAQGDVEAGVYAALLHETYHGVPASQMVVSGTMVAMPSLQGSSSEWLKAFDGVPVPLRELASGTAPTQGRRLDPSMVPAGTRVIPAPSIKAFFVNPAPGINWAAFRTQVNAQGWLALSGVLSAGDRLNALVYYEARCGDTCGEGGYMWLRREAAGSPWRVAKRIVSWAS